MDSEDANKGFGANANLSSCPTPPDVTITLTPSPSPSSTPALQTPPHLNGGQTTPDSPFTDTSSPALTLSASAVSTGTTYTDLTSLPSDVSKLSLGIAKKPPPPPAATKWPYSHSAALDDIPGIAYALDTFLKSQMVESEEYCHRNDPEKYVDAPESPFSDLKKNLLRERLYFATGFGMIQCVKALMSYEDDVRYIRERY
jgi:hypothetical protein